MMIPDKIILKILFYKMQYILIDNIWLSFKISDTKWSWYIDLLEYRKQHNDYKFANRFDIILIFNKVY